MNQQVNGRAQKGFLKVHWEMLNKIIELKIINEL